MAHSILELRSDRRALWLDVILPWSAVYFGLIPITILFYLFADRIPYGIAEASSSFQIFCDANGGFNTESTSAGMLWNKHFFLTITLAFGDFDFSQAKALDAASDLVLGKGGQFLLGMVAYRVIRRSATFAMEAKELHIIASSSLATEQISQHSLASIFWRGGGFGLVQWLCILIVCIYVISFSTLTSLLTGYNTRYQAYVVDPTDAQSLIEPSRMWSSDLVVYDGHRIGLQDDFPSTATYSNGTMSTLAEYWMMTVNTTVYEAKIGQQYWVDYVCSSGRCGGNISRVQSDDGKLSWYNGMASSWINVDDQVWDLDTQALNVSISTTTAALNIWPWTHDHGDPFDWRSGFVNTAGSQFESMWAYGNVTVTESWVVAQGSCQPSKNYQWGISSQLFLLFCVFTILFAQASAFLQWQLYWHSRVDRIGHDSSLMLDMMMIVDEVRRVLGDDAGEMSAKKLQRSIAARKDGIRLDLDRIEPPLSRSEERKLPLSEKLRQHEDRVHQSGVYEAMLEVRGGTFHGTAKSYYDPVPQPTVTVRDNMDADRLKCVGAVTMEGVL